MTLLETDLIQTRREDAVLVVTLNNPKRLNALSIGMRDSLTEVLAKAMDAKTVRAILLTGAGKSFCSGGDVSSMGAPRTVLESRARMAGYHHLVRLLAAGPKPVIAAVEGHAFGLGMSMALACDHVVAASNARFCAAFARLGLLPDVGMFWTLPRRVGMTKAKELIALATEIDGQDAQTLGVANQVVEPGTTLEAGLEVAHRYAKTAPLAFALTKAAFANGSVDSLDAALRAEIDYVPLCIRTSDHLNAVKAFMEKRAVTFSGED